MSENPANPSAEPDPGPDRTFELDPPEGPAGAERSSWIGPLFLVPLGLVVAAVALYAFMTWMVSDPKDPGDYLGQLLSGGTNARKQAFNSLVLSLQEYAAQGRLDELPPDFERRLAAAFDNAQEPMVRVATAYALGFLGSELAFDRLEQMVRDARADGGMVEPSNALESLGVVEIEHLNPLTKGIEFLGWLADPRATPLLADLLEDSDPGVRQITAAALGNIPGAEALPPLQRALRDENREVRRNAAVGLAKRGDPSGLPVLLGMLSLAEYDGYRNDDYRDQAILFALQSLRSLEADEAREAVQELADGEQTSLRVVSEARKWLEEQAAGWPAERP